MAHWLYSANVKYYDVMGAFRESETYWPLNSKVSIGDVIYIYLAAPYKQIAYICEVLSVDHKESRVAEKIRHFFKENMRDKSGSKSFMKLRITATLQIHNNSLLSYDILKQHGLNGMVMGPRKLEKNPMLLGYIKDITS